MQAEWGSLGAAAAQEINETRRRGGRIVAAGTTSLRLVESASDGDGVLRPFSGETSLFAAYLADVHRALISEVPFDVDRVCGFLKDDRANSPSNYAIVTVSEGAYPEGGEIIESGTPDPYGHRKLGGIGHFLAEEIKTRTGIDVMLLPLSYLMHSSFGNTTLAVGVRNLTDKNPPYVYNETFIFTDPGYDLVGRFIYGRLTQSF